MSLQTKDLVAGIKRRPLLVVCGALALVFGLALYFRAGHPSELRTKLAEREKEFTRLSNNVKFSAQLDAQLQTLRKVNGTIESGALRSGDLARNQQVFLRLLPETGVKLVDLVQSPVVAKATPGKGPAPQVTATYAPISFNLTVEGDYPQLVDFLKRLERGATLSRITSARMSVPAEGKQTVTLTVELLGLRS